MVGIWDGVLASSTCTYLHTAASLGQLGDLQHTVFSRQDPSAPRNCLEHALDSILAELDDSSSHVEYWWRETWEHVEAHADLDEVLFESRSVARYPSRAHVLYLNIGAAVRAPTCVWEASTLRDSKLEEDRHADFGAMTVVPARSGRLLRFHGDMMHAVPKPTHAWLPTLHGSMPKRKKAPAAELVRSVLLFNTWDEAPEGVGPAPSTDPRAVIEQLARDFSSPKIEALVKVMAVPDERCQPASEWTPVVPRELPCASGGNAVPMSVALLGTRARRQHEGPSLQMAAPEGLLDALMEPLSVTSFEQPAPAQR